MAKSAATDTLGHIEAKRCLRLQQALHNCLRPCMQRSRMKLIDSNHRPTNFVRLLILARTTSETSHSSSCSETWAALAFANFPLLFGLGVLRRCHQWRWALLLLLCTLCLNKIQFFEISQTYGGPPLRAQWGKGLVPPCLDGLVPSVGKHGRGEGPPAT